MWTEAAGFATIPGFLDPDDLALLDTHTAAVGADRGGTRNLLDVEPLRRFATSPKLRGLLREVLGDQPLPVRAILFDKTPDANWKVTWHQDVTIAVRERVDVEGFGPWSEKEGVIHVQPPASVLESMLAVRFHLDDCGEDNGPVRVLPGTHRMGKISESAFPALREKTPEHVCTVPRGGALLMRPLLLHASSPAIRPGHRRVIHIEYAAGPLPDGLRWRWV